MDSTSTLAKRPRQSTFQLVRVWHCSIVSISSLAFAMPPPPWIRGARAPGPYQDDPSLEAEATEHVPQVSAPERPKDCVNRHSTPPFSLLCTMMDRLRSEEANKRRDTLSRFMNLWRIKVGNDLYPLIRLILPDVSFVSY